MNLARPMAAGFAVLLKSQRVAEWSTEGQEWRTLDPSSRIEDPCLVAPLPVQALLDAAAAKRAVVAALAARREPALLQREAVERAEGKAEGKAEALLAVLQARGLAIGEEQRREILACPDLARLGRWLERALSAHGVDELLAED